MGNYKNPLRALSYRLFQIDEKFSFLKKVYEALLQVPALYTTQLATRTRETIFSSLFLIFLNRLLFINFTSSFCNNIQLVLIYLYYADDDFAKKSKFVIDFIYILFSLFAS